MTGVAALRNRVIRIPMATPMTVEIETAITVILMCSKVRFRIKFRLFTK